MDYNSQPEQRVSKINTAGLQNLRRSALWEDANNHSRQGLYKKWNEDLDRVWLELVGTIKSQKKKDGEENDNKISKEEEEFNKIEEEIGKLSVPKQSKGFKQVDKDDYENLVKLKKKLMEKETFLRKLEDVQGKGSAYETDDDYMD